MANRKTATKAANVDLVTVAVYAFKGVKTKADYSRIVAANTTTNVAAAWNTLSAEDQERIQQICNDTPQPDLSAIAQELVACGTLIQLQAVKAERGEEASRTAWKLIPVDERRRLKALCDNGQQPQPVTEPATSSQLEPQPQWNGAYTQDLTEQWSEQQTQLEAQPKTRSLFSISDDIEKLNELLDELSDDTQQQELINNWLEQLGDERDRKLDAYAALVSEMLARAQVRKSEAKRMQELAVADENRAKLLKDRLKSFFQMHNLTKVETARYHLSIARNGGKQPLILDESIPVSQLPEQFQKVSIDPDTAAIRDVLERGEHLNFARLGERGTTIRIK